MPCIRLVSNLIVMNLRKALGWSSALCLSAGMLQAQETNVTEKFEQKLKEMQENFDKAQKEMKEHFEKMVRDQQQEIEALKKQVANSATNAAPQPAPTPGPTSTNLATSAEQKKLEAELAAELGANATNQPPKTETTGSSAVSTPWSPSQPITVARAGSAYMNISFDVLIDVGSSTASDPSQFLELGDHDPINRGFSLPNAEIALDGAVDPYFKGFANIVFKLDKDNETEVELEETYLQSSSLPANLQLKGGQYFAAFGRQNPQHPHQWAFVDEPIILT